MVFKDGLDVIRGDGIEIKKEQKEKALAIKTPQNR